MVLCPWPLDCLVTDPSFITLCSLVRFSRRQDIGCGWLHHEVHWSPRAVLQAHVHRQLMRGVGVRNYDGIVHWHKVYQWISFPSHTSMPSTLLPSTMMPPTSLLLTLSFLFLLFWTGVGRQSWHGQHPLGRRSHWAGGAGLIHGHPG